jgi:hypothetical protein
MGSQPVHVFEQHTRSTLLEFSAGLQLPSLDTRCCCTAAAAAAAAVLLLLLLLYCTALAGVRWFP